MTKKFWIEFLKNFASGNELFVAVREWMSVDVIVVGAGHAGIEAALAAHRLGLRVVVGTVNLDRVGYMSCNPSIGGLGKGHIVKEIDILGGEMGLAADATCIQFKVLNSTKGPAVRGSRAQCDKDLYSGYMKQKLGSLEGLSLVELEVKSLLVESDRVRGVQFEDGSVLNSSAVVLTTGTFMRGVMHIGLSQEAGGRVGDRASVGLSDQLRDLGLTIRRLKTGTPPRLKRSSIDWEKFEPQFGDDEFRPFSFRSSEQVVLPQVACHLGYTNERTHEIIRSNLDKSPMFCGVIEGVGPRYCPSIEDKITRFAEKVRHQTFLEPESLSSDSIYLQGISTSLPIAVQYEFLRTIPGLESVEILRPGYAVEYDFIEPSGITHSLESRGLKGLFLAGQINGTSGYEEAAGQGLVAGANAAARVLGKPPLVLERSESYIGVMIDDLVTKGTREPYRMMTSRAEHRLLLREDNVLERLADKAGSFGLISQKLQDEYSGVLRLRSKTMEVVENTWIYPDALTQQNLDSLTTHRLSKPLKLADLLRRPEISISDLEVFGLEISSQNSLKVLEPVEISVKYDGYIRRQKDLVAKFASFEGLRIPPDFNYSIIHGLSREEVEKLSAQKPYTLGQAMRMSGVNPSAGQAILVYLMGRQKKGLIFDAKQR